MGIIDRIKNYLVSRELTKQYSLQTERDLEYFIRAERLKECIYKCKEPGITDERYCEHEVIVSLTTFGKRLYDVATTIESIMQGSMLPNRIVLWLGEEHKDEELPLSLQLQQKRGLQVEYCKDIRSYTKLVPSLKKYPNEIIITIDDDCLYNRDILENLINSHKKYPNYICANRIHTIVLGNDNKPISYLNWKWCTAFETPSPLHFFTGVGGVLYPPLSLDEEVFNEKVFLDICKYADDIWFNAMALKAKTKVQKSFTHSIKGEDYYENVIEGERTLNSTNNGTTRKNDIQMKQVFEMYNLYPLLKQ